MNPRRLYGPVVLATLAAGGAVVLTAGRPWARTTVGGTGVPDDVLGVTGTQAVPLVAALGVVVVTAALGVLATRGHGRRIVGGLVVALGLGIVVLVATAGDPLASAVEDAVAASPSFTGTNDPASVERTAWRWVTLLCAALVTGLGVVIVRFAHRWPGLSGRYDAPRSTRDDTDDDIWKALDDGRDPTE